MSILTNSMEIAIQKSKDRQAILLEPNVEQQKTLWLVYYKTYSDIQAVPDILKQWVLNESARVTIQTSVLSPSITKGIAQNIPSFFQVQATQQTLTQSNQTSNVIPQKQDNQTALIAGLSILAVILILR